MSNLARKTLLALALYYAIIAGLAAVWFSTRYVQARGWHNFAALGEVESAVNGLIWPVSLVFGGITIPNSNETMLSDGEWALLARSLPTTQKPYASAADVAAMRKILDGFRRRTGHDADPAAIARRFARARLVFELHFEAGRSAALSWDRGITLKTPRYNELAAQLANQPSLAGDLRMFDAVFIGAGERERIVTVEGRPIDIRNFVTTELQYRAVMTAQDAVLAALLPPPVADRTPGAPPGGGTKPPSG